MTLNFYAIVVIYNKSIEESLTCKNLLKITNHKINTIIVDNSTNLNFNKVNATLSKSKDFKYLSMNGNVGLSIAYNKALDYIKNKEGIVIWFDDDSNVTQEYFDELSEAIKDKSYDIFVPVIQGQDKLFWSPNKANYFKNHQLKSANEVVPQDKFNAINSCTACRLKVYEDYRYDERLFLDQVDQKFFDDQRERHMKFYKLKTIIHHNFSLKGQNINEEKIESRYQLRVNDFIEYSNIQGYPKILCKIKILLWGIAETRKTKKIITFRFFLRMIDGVK